MKKIAIIGICVLMTGLFASAGHAASPTKVMINVVEESGDSSSEAMIKGTEMLIARELLNNQFDVLTSDDLSEGKGLSDKDVTAARKGSMTEMRKAAALRGAAYILSAKAKTSVSEENVINMKMNKAVTSFSYRIVNAATGRTVDMDSVSFSSADRSAEKAAHSTYQKLSTEMAQRIQKKLPAELSAKQSKELAGYKTSVMPSLKPKVTAKAVVTPAMDMAQASPQKTDISGAPQKSGGPEIVILNPPPNRGFKTVSRQKKLNIEGLAVDPTGISEVRINGEKVGYDPKGHFLHPVTLSPGENRFLVMAVNTAGKMVSKEVAVDRDQDSVPPDIVLLRPGVTRGFQVAIKPKVKNTIVDGMIKDESNLLFVRINDTEIPIAENGHFLYEMPVNDATRNISIEAADIHGNIARKSLEVTRGENAWTESSSSPVHSSGPAVKPVLWGMAIGVSKYSSSAINLRYADQDAMKLAKFFESQAGKSFSEVHFKTLINDQVSRNSIIEGITRHLGMAAPNDIIFLFVAGHGIKHRQSGSYYFMPADADFDTVLSKGLRMSDFEESIKILSKNVNKIIVAMDTCHSGALEVGMRGSGDSEDLAAAMNAASGLYILSASKAGEVSMESDKFKLDPKFSGHGAFTYTLVQAMQGQADYDKDNYVSLNEVFQFVSRQVPRLTSGQQHPYFRMQGTDLQLLKLK
ncbi:MAG: caspase family protein [Desulfobacteraceae bacterium]|jgi:hypothetical protein|nr:caspase family protein [Desulfobacteraceae bacterium]